MRGPDTNSTKSASSHIKLLSVNGFMQGRIQKGGGAGSSKRQVRRNFQTDKKNFEGGFSPNPLEPPLLW